MSYEEPIVVNPPREKIVQTFDDSDIRTIVQNGISAGQIAIPTGAKLYLHVFSFNVNDEDSSYPHHSLSIVSTLNKPVTLAELKTVSVDNILYKSKQILTNDAAYFGYRGYYVGFFIVGSETNYNASTIKDDSKYKDNVTEL